MAVAPNHLCKQRQFWAVSCGAQSMSALHGLPTVVGGDGGGGGGCGSHVVVGAPQKQWNTQGKGSGTH